MSIRHRTTRAPRGTRRVLAVAAVLGALPAVLSVQPAVAVPGCYGDCQPGVLRSNGVLRYDAPVGVNDQITISPDGAQVTVANLTAPLTVGAGCTLVTEHQASCVFPGSQSMRVRGLDGNDVITNSTSINADLLGGDGNDQLTGGSGDDLLTGGLGSDLLKGGGGSDTVSYSDTPNGIGVHADLDGATGDDGSSTDGPAGARDTIAADVENLEGSLADDVLIGNAGPNIINARGGHDQLQGLGGSDQLTGRGGGTVDGGADADHCTSDLRGLLVAADSFIGCETTEIIN